MTSDMMYKKTHELTFDTRMEKKHADVVNVLFFSIIELCVSFRVQTSECYTQFEFQFRIQ